MQRCPELEELTLELYAAVSEGDPGFFERHLSKRDGSVVVGTAPGEWWDDGGSALDAIRAQMKSAGASVRLAAGDLRGWQEGDVGWIADRPTLRVGGAEAECRHTSVFVREDGIWRLVQHHFSIGVPNDAVFGAEAARLA